MQINGWSITCDMWGTWWATREGEEPRAEISWRRAHQWALANP